MDDNKTAILMGLQTPPTPEIKKILVQDLTENQSIRSIAAYYHKLDQNSRIKRKPFGGIEAEMLYSSCEDDERRLREMKSKIGNYEFSFDGWSTYFVGNQIILQIYLVDEIFRQNIKVND